MKRSGFSDESKRRSREKAIEKARTTPRKPLKRTAMKRKVTTKPMLTAEEKRQLAGFREAALAQACCANPECASSGPWDPHHVIERQLLEREGLRIFHADNALRLCKDCHRRHTIRHVKIRLTWLTIWNLRYAIMLLGPDRAENNLRRNYAGEDPRLDQLLKDVRDG